MQKKSQGVRLTGFIIYGEKAGFRPLFRKPVPKPMGFWNRLRGLADPV
jgi:hypothetical protein